MNNKSVDETKQSLKLCVQLATSGQTKLKKECSQLLQHLYVVDKEIIAWENDTRNLKTNNSKDEITVSMIHLEETVLTSLTTNLKQCAKLLKKLENSNFLLKPRFGKKLEKLTAQIQRDAGLFGMSFTYIKADWATRGLLKLGTVTGHPFDFQSENVREVTAQADKFYIGLGVSKDYFKAFELYSVAAKMNDPRSQFLIGSMLMQGLGVNKDLKKGIQWIQKAAEQKYPDALNEMGKFHQTENEVVTRNVNLAVTFFKKAAELDHLDAMVNLGTILIFEHDYNKNIKLGVEWISKAALREYSKAQNVMGSLYFYGIGVEQNYTKAFELFKKSADQLFPEALNNLAVCFEEGKGVVTDFDKAVTYYEAAAKAGSEKGICNLGYIRMVLNDMSTAKELFLQAIDLGSVDAMYYLATMYEKMFFEHFDAKELISKSIQYYKKAAELGQHKAMKRMADFYFDGYLNLVEKDIIKAKQLYYKSAMLGNAEAQNNYALLMEEVKMDEAIQWYQKSIEKGNIDAMYNLASLLESNNLIIGKEWDVKELYQRAAEAGHIAAREKYKQLTTKPNSNNKTFKTTLLP